MGPTATGKTDVAIELRKRYPFEIISVDSVLVYRGMDIGTAKPDAETLRFAPHRLVDILNPEEAYSAGDFVRDAQREMQEICAAGRVPLLVGGTMMYFRALLGGIAKLPTADVEIRRAIDADAEKLGWPAMHARLHEVDPVAAERINANDSQRIQRALEVFDISGRCLTDWQQEAGEGTPETDMRFLKVALQIPDRQVLHQRIEARLAWMFSNGFVDEVAQLRQRPARCRSMLHQATRTPQQHSACRGHPRPTPVLPRAETASASRGTSATSPSFAWRAQPHRCFPDDWYATRQCESAPAQRHRSCLHARFGNGIHPRSHSIRPTFI